MPIMKQAKDKKTAHMTVKVSPALRKRIEAMAQKEQRSIAGQVTYLIEKGLTALAAETAMV